jgi:vacuolar-type H+-ATPase subunit F/Vma7
MRARVHVICSREAALGVGLVGLTPLVVANGEEAAAAMTRLSTEPARGGVVLIEQALYDALPPSTRRQLRREGLPVVMPFPGPGLPLGTPPEQELLDILRGAIGYHLRLR